MKPVTSQRLWAKIARHRQQSPTHPGLAIQPGISGAEAVPILRLTGEISLSVDGDKLETATAKIEATASVETDLSL